ncbi:MAG: copper resistance protein CopC [Microbacteriaceae bacterium]|nr:copper resistance protein CopC [Microbacteriaceae bacterium]
MKIAKLATISAVVSIGLLFAGQAVYAHDFYVSSTPSEDEVLTSLPDQFIVTMNENLLNLDGKSRGFVMEIEGPDGLYYGDGCVTVSGPSVSTRAAAGPAGEYELEWQVISADGHSVSGDVDFTWAPNDPNWQPLPGSATPPVCNEVPGSVITTAPSPTQPESTGSSTLWLGVAIVSTAIALAAIALLLIRRKKPEQSDS